MGSRLKQESQHEHRTALERTRPHTARPTEAGWQLRAMANLRQLDVPLRPVSDQERPTSLHRPGRRRTHRRLGLRRRSSRCAQRDRANPHCLTRFGSLQNASACRGPCCLRPRVKPSVKSPRWRVQPLRFCAGRTRCPHARRVHSDATTGEPRGRTRPRSRRHVRAKDGKSLVPSKSMPKPSRK